MTVQRLGIYLAAIVATAAVAAFCYVVYEAIVAPPRNDIDPQRFVDERHHVEADKEMGWALRRSHSVLVPGPIPTMSHTDDRGARVAAKDRKAWKKVDVVIVGGSQTWGQGLPYDQIITAQLEKALDAKVANYSVPGFGGTGSLIALTRNFDQRPSWIVYGFWEDHLRRNVIPGAPTAADTCLEYPSVRFREDGSAYIKPPSNPVKAMRVSRRWYRETTTRVGGSGTLFTDIYWTADRLYTKSIRPLFDTGAVAPYDDPRFQWKAARHVLNRMLEAASGIGARLIVVWIPLYFSDKLNAFPNDLASELCARGLRLIEGGHLVDDLRSRGEDVSIAGDGHLSPAAHRMLADRIAKIVAGASSDCPMAAPRTQGRLRHNHETG